MSNGLSNVVDELEEQDRERECEGRTGRCPQCEREGFPILPVRYAVCKNIESNSDIPELPPSRVEEFTKITLNKALENGREVNKRSSDSLIERIENAGLQDALDPDLLARLSQWRDGKTSKYILRQLRPGYFYVFDRINRPFYWYAFVVSADGMFHQYSVRDTPPTPEQASFSCRNAPEEEGRRKALSASVVTLPRVAMGDVFYYAYTEHPWSREHLSMIEGNDDWREKNMQKFVITGEPSASDDSDNNNNNPENNLSKPGDEDLRERNTFSLKDLDLVAEYCGGSVERMDFFWPVSDARRLFTPEEMKESMRARLRNHADWLQGQEMILAVNDEAGVIDELNAYRMEPVKEFQDYLYRNNKENQRKLVFMQALDAFRENFKRAQVKETNETYGKFEEEVQESLEEKIKKYEKIMLSTDNDALRREYEELIKELEAQHEDNEGVISSGREEAEERAEDIAKDRDEQVRELYDDSKLLDFYDKNKNALDVFRTEYSVMVEATQWLEDTFDADYALWIKYHLEPIMGRYSSEDFVAGLGISALVTALLTGGILSPSTFCVWKELSNEISSSDSVIVKSLFCNNELLINSAVTQATSLSRGVYLGRARLDEWIGRFNDLLRPYGHLQDELERRVQSILPPLISLVSNSMASVRLQGGEGDRPPVETFVRYTQMLYCAQLAVRGSGEEDQEYRQEPLQLMKVRLKPNDFQQWLVHMANQNQPDAETPIVDNSMAFPDGEGGNIYVGGTPLDGTSDITLYIPVVNLENANIDAVDDEDIEQWKTENMRSFVSVGTSFIELATVKEISRFSVAEPLGKYVASGISVILSINVLIDELLGRSEDENADKAKIASAIGILVKAGKGMYDAILELRGIVNALDTAGSLSTSTASSIFKIRPEKLTVFSAVGAVGDVISIYDGLNQLIETNHEEKLGLSQEAAGRSNLQSGLTIAGGAIGLISLFVGGLPVAFVGLVVGGIALFFAYLYVELVAKAVRMWINRSLFGNHLGQIEPFRSGEEELASLGLVFKGLTVDITWEHVNIRDGFFGEKVVEAVSDPRSASGMMFPPNGKRFNIEILAPDLGDIRLEFSLYSMKSLGGVERLMNSVYEVVESNGVLEKKSASSIGDNNFVDNEGGFYKVSETHAYMSSQLGGGAAELRVKFIDNNSGNVHSAPFRMSW